MNLNDLLIYIDEYSSSKGYRPFIVGGAVRDAFLFPDNVPNDIDISTGNKTIYNLAYDLSKKFPGADFRIMDDGHTTLTFVDFRIDFSNNFVSNGVKNILKKKGIKASPLKQEVFSRDFTINTLLMDLKRTTVYDVTERGVSDIKSKVIRCPVNPLTTLLDDPKRMLRAVKYSMRLGFRINDAEVDVIKNNAGKISELPAGYVNKIVGDILDVDEKLGVEKLYELKLLKHVPLSKRISKIMIQNRELAKYFR